MTKLLLFAALVALVMCLVVSLIEDFVLPYRARKPRQHWNPVRAFFESGKQQDHGQKPT